MRKLPRHYIEGRYYRLSFVTIQEWKKELRKSFYTNNNNNNKKLNQNDAFFLSSYTKVSGNLKVKQFNLNNFSFTPNNCYLYPVMEAEILKINDCINGKWPALIQHLPRQHSHTDTLIHTQVTVTTLHPSIHTCNTDGTVSHDKLGFCMLSKDTSEIETGGGLNWTSNFTTWTIINKVFQSEIQIIRKDYHMNYYGQLTCISKYNN